MNYLICNTFKMVLKPFCMTLGSQSGYRNWWFMLTFWCSLWINLVFIVSVQQRLNSLFLRTWETVYSWVVLRCHLSAFIHLSTHTMGNVLNFPFPMMIGSVWVQCSTPLLIFLLNNLLVWTVHLYPMMDPWLLVDFLTHHWRFHLIFLLPYYVPYSSHEC